MKLYSVAMHIVGKRLGKPNERASGKMSHDERQKSNRKRNPLKPERANKLVFVHYNKRLIRKIKRS